MKMPIYMDHNATTPVDPRVVEAMLPCFSQHFGNAASRTHAYGWAASKLVEDARAAIAEGIGAHPEEVVFTSGATEANNLAIKGFAMSLPAGRRHVVTCATEHKAVLDPCAALGRAGFEVTVVPVDSCGRLDLGRVEAALGPRAGLATIMLANNETGTLHDVAAISALCRARGVALHCDATQAVGKVPVDVRALAVDLLSLSAHKICGPKGTGALYVRRARPRLHLVPVIDGGGHEQGMRSGTLNVPGIVGFARALEIARAEMADESARLAGLRDRLEHALTSRLDAVTVNGDPDRRLPNTLNASFAGVDGAALLVGLKEVAVASGSACTSADPRPSHVLIAMGRPKELANASIRFSLGRSNTADEVDLVAEAVVREVERLRASSPLWRR